MRVAQHWSCFSNYPSFWMPQLIRACTLTHITRTIFRQTFRLLFSQNPMALPGHALPSPSIPALCPPPQASLASGLTPGLGRTLCQDKLYLFLCSLERPPTRLGISTSYPSLRHKARRLVHHDSFPGPGTHTHFPEVWIPTVLEGPYECLLSLFESRNTYKVLKNNIGDW